MNTSIRYWNPYEIDISPLILNRNPSQFTRQVSTFVLPTSHSQYAELKELLRNWYTDVPIGKGFSVDCTTKLDYDEIVPKCWYILDLRAKPDETLKNRIVMKHWDQLPAFAQTRLAFELYEKVKGLVVFADKYSDVPATLWANSVLGLSSETSADFTEFIRSGVMVTANNNANIVRTNSDTLAGYHRFECMPTFVEW